MQATTIRQANVRLCGKLWDEVRHQAIREQRLPRDIVTDALRDYLRRDDAPGGAPAPRGESPRRRAGALSG